MKKKKTFPVIECSGSDYEIGRQYGEQAKDDIRNNVAFLFASMENMPYKAGKDSVIKAAWKYLENVRAFDPGAVDRVKGTADGAGISFDEAFAVQCFSELFVNYPGLAGMCTSFAVSGAATKNGTSVLGQNIDWHPDSVVNLVRIRRADGVRVLGIILNGYGAVYLTSDGVGNCANMTLCPTAPIRDHLPFAIYLYAAMRAKTARQAMEVLRKTARGVGYIHVADSSGAMAGIESVYDDHVIIEPQKGVLVHANHYEADRYKKSDLASIYIKDSFSRAERLRQLIANSHGSITLQRMMAFMADHEGYPHSVCTHVDTANPSMMPSQSVLSVIMVPAEGRMLISAGKPCNYEYVEYRV